MRPDILMPGHRLPDTTPQNTALEVGPDDFRLTDFPNEFLSLPQNVRLAYLRGLIQRHEEGMGAKADAINALANARELCLELEQRYSEIAFGYTYDLPAPVPENQADSLSWFRQVIDYLHSGLTRVSNPSSSREYDDESITSHEVALAREELSGFGKDLRDIFVKHPELRAASFLLIMMLVSILLLLPSAVSQSALATSSLDRLPVPAAQVAAHYSDQHFSTPIPNLSSNLPTSSSTPQPPALDSTPRPPLPPASVVDHLQTNTNPPEQPSPTPTVTANDLLAAAIGGLELTPAQVGSLTQDLHASIQRFYAASNADFDVSDPELLTAIRNNVVTQTNPIINPLTLLPSYEITYNDITYRISLFEPEISENKKTNNWVTSLETSQDPVTNDSSKTKIETRVLHDEVLTHPSEEEIARIQQLINESTVNIVDLSSPTYENYDQQTREAIGNANVALVIRDGDQWYIQGHGAMISHFNNNYFVTANHLLHRLSLYWQHEVENQPLPDLYLVFPTIGGYDYLKMAIPLGDLRRIAESANEHGEGLCYFNLKNSGYDPSHPPLMTISESELIRLRGFDDEGANFQALTCPTSSPRCLHVSMEGSHTSPQFGRVLNWRVPSEENLIQPTDSGRGVFYFDVEKKEWRLAGLVSNYPNDSNSSTDHLYPITSKEGGPTTTFSAVGFPD